MQNYSIVSETKTWMCLICGWIYDEAAGDPEHGIAPGTRWEDVDMNWTCPECGARKEDFEMVQI
ncbi:rubredoxin [Pelomonas sp. CA6]|uniref:rubredoxin n=1 Tax=Pelomonas sp. CA6 TaxID=2907999 RepID=UPI0024087CFF|nr:rubredoxin [Pelomonas sp. CA6]